MKYLRRSGRYLVCMFLLAVSFNLYFLFFLTKVKAGRMVYLDILLTVFFLSFTVVDVLRCREMEKRKQEMLMLQTLISQDMQEYENIEIADHDVELLKTQVSEQFDANCDLQDYIAKWCHEVKIPLAASLLMVERISDQDLKKSMEEQLERINQQLKSALLGCKVQGSLFDINISQVSLRECVRTSVKNNQFFLIRKGFQMDIKMAEGTIFTDLSWLVYVLDQIIDNAIKYAGEDPVIKIWTMAEKGTKKLFIEDNGEGILKKDIRHIFAKGFTGSNHHNGKYKSTGMGLYMSSLILQKLGHEITVESEYGSYTRFCIVFKDNRLYFNMV